MVEIKHKITQEYPSCAIKRKNRDRAHQVRPSALSAIERTRGDLLEREET